MKIPYITGNESKEKRRNMITGLAKIDTIMQRTDFTPDYKWFMIKQIILEIEQK